MLYKNKFLKNTVLATILLGNTTAMAEDFSFEVITDPHILSSQLDENRIDAIRETFRAIDNQKGDFLITTGDLDPFVEIKNTFNSVFNTQNYPLYVAVGNHDTPSHATGNIVKNWADIQDLIGFNKEKANMNWMEFSSTYGSIYNEGYYELAEKDNHYYIKSNYGSEDGGCEQIEKDPKYYVHERIDEDGTYMYDVFDTDNTTCSGTPIKTLQSGYDSKITDVGYGSKFTSYSFDHKGTHFVVLDLYSGNYKATGNSGDTGQGIIEKAKIDWLVNDLNNVGTNTKNIMVFAHEPVWTTSRDDASSLYGQNGETVYLPNHGTKKSIQKGGDAFWQVLTNFNANHNETKVVAYFCGHEDTYNTLKKDGIWEVRSTQAKKKKKGFTKVYINDNGSIYAEMHKGSNIFDRITIKGDKNSNENSIAIVKEDGNLKLSNKNNTIGVWYNTGYVLNSHSTTLNDAPLLNLDGSVAQNINTATNSTHTGSELLIDIDSLIENKIYHLSVEVKYAEDNIDISTVSIQKDENGNVVVKDENEKVLTSLSSGTDSTTNSDTDTNTSTDTNTEETGTPINLTTVFKKNETDDNGNWTGYWTLLYDAKEVESAEQDKVVIDGVEDRIMGNMNKDNRSVNTNFTYSKTECHKAYIVSIRADESEIAGTKSNVFEFGDTSKCDNSTPDNATSTENFETPSVWRSAETWYLQYKYIGSNLANINKYEIKGVNGTVFSTEYGSSSQVERTLNLGAGDDGCHQFKVIATLENGTTEESPVGSKYCN